MTINRMRILVAILLAVVVASLLPSASAQADCTGLELLATIPVGPAPREIVADAVRRRVYVANRGDQTITVIDTSTASVVGSWPLTGPIRMMALNPTTGALYIDYDLLGRTELWMLAAESGQHVRGLWFDWRAEALAVDDLRQRVYLAGTWGSPHGISFERISVVDAEITAELHTSGAEDSRNALTNYSGVAVDEQTGTVYAAHHYKYHEQSHVRAFGAELRGSAGGIDFRESSSSPDQLVIDSVRRRALLTMGGGLRIVDIGISPRWLSDSSDPPMSVSLVRVTGLGSGRLHVALDGIAGVAYIGPYIPPWSANITPAPAAFAAVDVLTAQVLGRIPPASGGRRITVDASTHRVYVSHEIDGTVSVFRGFAAADTPAC